MKCIALVVIMALAATNGQLVVPNALNYAGLSGLSGLSGLDALSYRGFAGAFSHPFSSYSPYYGARFGGYDAPIAYGGVPASALSAYSGVPSVYAAPTVVDSALKPIVKEAPIAYEGIPVPAAYSVPPTAYSAPLAYNTPFAYGAPAPYSTIPGDYSAFRGAYPASYATPYAPTPFAAPYANAPFAGVPQGIEIGVPKATFIAKTPGLTFEADLPGHWQSVVAENLDLAPTAEQKSE